VYIKLHRKSDALNAFGFALRQKYDNWKMWQNYMYVAVDVGDFSSVIRSMDRIFDILVHKDGAKDQVVDVDVRLHLNWVFISCLTHFLY
jgi:hypothetical protein